MSMKITKPVRRVIGLPLDHRIEARDRDNVTVSIYPEGVIGFRPKRGRREYFYPLARVYAQAVRAQAESEEPNKRKRV